MIILGICYFFILILFFDYSFHISYSVMEDDDTDFTPSPSHNTSSKLASLFEFTKKPLQGNSSFTYTAPKAPKRESSPAKKQSEEKTKGKIIFSKAVHAYKLENRSYVNQGLTGIVISGNHVSKVYEIILYKRTKEHLCQIRISGSFCITLSPNNYASFYDTYKQNWSVMFQSAADVEQFSQKVAICKFYSSPASDILIQDLAPASQQKTNSNSTTEVTYDTYTLVPEELSKLKEGIKEKLNLSDYSFTQFSRGLIDCSKNCKRVIIIPHSLSGPWLNDLGPDKDLLIEVKIEKIIELETSILESPTDSSAEEAIVKGKGALMKEMLAGTKSHKANLISRMARMGQATLPVKPELFAGASDSEEESSLACSPKPRLLRSRSTVPTNSCTNPTVSQSSFCQNSDAQQQLTVYQNDIPIHQKLGTPYQQLMPVSVGSVSSPTSDPNMSIFLSESRIQAAELRMGISKMSEKIDLVWNKLQNLSGVGVESKVLQQCQMDSGGILTSIQNLIAENESLKEKVEEQRGKIEQHSDRIYHLLELNHKYLEQNSTSHEKQSANESKLKAEMECLLRKELEMEAASKMASDRVKNLEGELTRSEEHNKELIKRVEELTVNAEAFKKNLKGNNDEKEKELEGLKEKIAKASETIMKLKDRLREVISENENLKSVIQNQKVEIETGSMQIRDSKTKNEAYEKTLENLKRQISEEETKTESKMESLSKLIAKLEEEKNCLIDKIEKKDYQKEVKTVLPEILSILKNRFSEPDKKYSVQYILTAVEEIFDDIMNETSSQKEKLENLKTDAVTMETVVPLPRTSLQNLQSLPKETEQRDPSKEEAKENNVEKENGEQLDTDSLRKKDEVDRRYKSYDQGWRTTRPPPPPLFDDDEEDDDWLD